MNVLRRRQFIATRLRYAMQWESVATNGIKCNLRIVVLLSSGQTVVLSCIVDCAWNRRESTDSGYPIHPVPVNIQPAPVFSLVNSCRPRFLQVYPVNVEKTRITGWIASGKSFHLWLTLRSKLNRASTFPPSPARGPTLIQLRFLSQSSPASTPTRSQRSLKPVTSVPPLFSQSQLIWFYNRSYYNCIFLVLQKDFPSCVRQQVNPLPFKILNSNLQNNERVVHRIRSRKRKKPCY